MYRTQFLEEFKAANARLRLKIRQLSGVKNSHRIGHGAVSAAEELQAFKTKLNEQVEIGIFDLPLVYQRDKDEPIDDRVHLSAGRWQAIFQISREQGIVFADTFKELNYSEILRQRRRHRFSFVKRSKKRSPKK